MTEIMVGLADGGKAPLYEKIYRHIRDEITDGRICQGERLPSTRLLAKNLEVSRSTVEMAYGQLLAEGYIRAEPCRGYYACDVAGLYRIGERAAGQPGAENGNAGWDGIDFSPYAIDAASFPFNVWRKISKNVLLEDSAELLSAGDGQGEYGLRAAIANYLHQARGVNCSAGDIILGAGNEYLELLLSQLLGPGRVMLMEDPGYPQAYQTFRNAGVEVRAVPAAGQPGREEGASLIYVMPSHQFPLGTVMPLKQRLSLLEWAAEGGNRFLIEDDHDSEYRYKGKPIPSLQGIDRCGKVIYLGTFSKSIAPSLCVSYMVLPPALMEEYHRKCGFYAVTVPRMQQEILRVFIEEGHFGRHLNKMRGIYRAKHDFLIGELKKRSWAGRVSGDRAGLHVLVEVERPMDEEELCRRALAGGVRVSCISQYCLSGTRLQGDVPVLLLGYGSLTEEEMGRGLHVLDEILKEEY